MQPADARFQKELSRMIYGCFLAALLCHYNLAAGQTDAPPDKIYVDGVVLTIAQSAEHVQAVAIKGDKIVAVGTNAEIRALPSQGLRRRQLIWAARRSCLVFTRHMIIFPRGDGCPYTKWT
jgi:hypothetical protein